MDDLEKQYANDSEVLFRELENAWLTSDAADPILATREQYEALNEAMTVSACGFGMTANVMRTAAAAIEMTKLGFGNEVGPLVRLTFEHAMAIQCLGTTGFSAVEAFGRAHANNLKRLQSISAYGQPGVHEAESKWMDAFRAAAANTIAGPADNAIKTGSIGTAGDGAMAMLYFGWLKTTQTSHAGIITSKNFVRMSQDDDSVQFQRMFVSDYDFVDCRAVLLTPVIEALWGYTRLGPTNLSGLLSLLMPKFDALNASFLAAKAARDAAVN